MLRLYVNVVVLFANTLGDAKKLMRVSKTFCMHTKFSVNSSKTKIMLLKSQNKNKPCIMYNNDLLEIVEGFNCLGLEVPS